VNSGRTNQF